MSFSRLYAEKTFPSLSIVLLSTVAFLLIGGSLLYWKAGQSLNRKALETAKLTVVKIDSILDQAANAASKTLLLSGRPCSESEPVLKRLVATHPFIRSANLTFDKLLYCSSLLVEYGESISAM